MKWLFILILSFILTVFSSAFGAYVDLSVNYGLNKQYYGESYTDKYQSESYYVNYAWYLWAYTALEFNYMKMKTTVTENDKTLIATNVYVVETENISRVEVFGTGIRQILAPQKSTIVPFLSAGFAREFKRNTTVYTVDNNGAIEKYFGAASKKQNDSCYGTFGIQIRLSELFRLNGSVRTVFKAFETDQAKYNLQYMAGLSWIF